MVLPIHDVNPVRRVPVVTYLLILANLAVFLTEPVSRQTPLVSASAARVCLQEAFVRQWGAIPKELISNGQLPLTVLGPGRGGCLVGPATYDKEPVLSALTAMFVHGGWLHLLGNMLFLYVFGNNVEDRLGRLRFLVFYLACGYAATYGFAAASSGSTTPLVGASGAIAGVLGAYLVLFPRARVWGLLTFFFFIPLRLPAWIVLGSWFLLQWAYARGAGVASGSGEVAYLAHVVGFLVGAAVVLPLRGGHATGRPAAPG